jgi:hypothetical protein
LFVLGLRRAEQQRHLTNCDYFQSDWQRAFCGPDYSRPQQRYDTVRQGAMVRGIDET